MSTRRHSPPLSIIRAITPPRLCAALLLAMWAIGAHAGAITTAGNNADTSANPSTAKPASPLQTVEVEGEAVIYHGDLPQARQRALDEAFSAALTRIMGAWISAESYSHNFQSIDRGVYNRSQGYIKTYEVLARNQQGGLLSLQVRVTVAAQQVKDDLAALGILLDQIDNPSLVVTGSEQGLSTPQAPSILREALLAQGIDVLNADQRANADLLIELDGSIHNQTRVASVGIYGAVVQLAAKAYWRQQQRLLVSDTEIANGAGNSASAALKQGYTDAAQRLAPRLIERLIAQWRELAYGSRVIDLTVDGSHAQVRRFQSRLGHLFGVRKASLKRYHDGQALLSVRFRGAASLLAELIARSKFDTIRVDITEVDRQRLALNLTPTSPPVQNQRSGPFYQ